MTSKWRTRLSCITVEPVIFFQYLALAFLRTAEHAGVYEVICINEFRDQFNVDCAKLKEFPHVEDEIQKRAATVNMFLSLAYLLPAIITDTLLGAWSDLNGRQINILLGFTGFALSTFPLILILTYPWISLNYLIIAHVICGMTGYIAIIMVSSLAYVVDITSDSNVLTLRMSRVYVFNTVATTLGSLAAGGMLKVVSLQYVLVANEIALACGFFYTLIFIKQNPPEKLATGQIAKSKSPKPGVLKFVAQLYKDIWITFSKKRPGRQRLSLWLISVVYFLFMISDLGLLHGPVLSLYAFRSPLNWSPAKLSFFKAGQSAVLAVGLFGGTWIAKSLLHWRDTSILLVALTSALCQLTLLAFSDKDWLMYLTIAVSCFSFIVLPTVKSISAQIVGKCEVGKMYAVNSVAADLAYVGSTLMFNNIYSASVERFAGAVFIFSACLIALCLLLTLIIHFERYFGGNKVDPKVNDNRCGHELSESAVPAAAEKVTNAAFNAE